jgi:DNA anti-recombination protein RmuC
MWEIVTETCTAFSGILSAIPRSIKNDLLFPPRRKTLEQQLQAKVKHLYSTVRRQQDELINLVGNNQSLSRENKELRDYLAQRDAEIKRLKEYIGSLELQLQTKSPRPGHVR